MDNYTGEDRLEFTRHLGSRIHILLVIAIIVVLVRIIQGRKVL